MRTRHIVLNISLTALIMTALWRSGPALEGIWFKVKLILYAPSFFIVFVVAGPNNAMHFTPEIAFDVISLFFYSISIAAIQFVLNLYSKKKRRVP